jgi:hypothetical protein
MLLLNIVKSHSDVNLDRRDSKWRNPWSREINRIYNILSKHFEIQGTDYLIAAPPTRQNSLSQRKTVFVALCKISTILVFIAETFQNLHKIKLQ